MEAITGIPDPVDGVISADLTLEAGSFFVPIEFEKEAGAYFTFDEPDANGTTGYMYTVNVFVSNNTAAQKVAIDLMDGVPLALIAVDKTGRRELLFDITENVKTGIRLRPTKEDGGKPGW